MTELWSRLNRRQQGLLIAAALIVTGVIVFVGLWEPLVEVRDQRRDQVAAQQALVSWLDAVGPIASDLRQRASRNQAGTPRSLLGLADETARAAGLAGSLSRIEPAGEDRVRVWLDQAEFVATMQWLDGLASGQPVSISQLNLERAGTSGQVNVRVTLLADG
ncbi:MAG: type II secretion system protein M [Wenzhouxiangella sp.]|jgi:general secretion pathway protein M|nr:type II secretion system protein M [Wenzhouxiangella sp.]